VEDDRDFAAITGLLLRHAGFAQPIIHCLDGVEALRYFSTLKPGQAPHIVLLDLHLPRIGGLDVLHWLRHGHTLRDIPIYLLTSSDDSDDRRRAAEDRVTGYLLKTPLLDDLIRHLDQQIALINLQSAAKARDAGQPRNEPFVLVG
jgi:CheY-like chemotaxis protein